MELRTQVTGILNQFGTSAAGNLLVHSPIDGREIGSVAETTPTEINVVVAQSKTAFFAWRNCPRATAR